VVLDLLALGAASLHGGLLLLAAGPVAPRRPVRDLLARLATGQPVDRTIEALAAPRTRLGQHLLQSVTDSGAVAHRDRRLLGVVPIPSHQVTAPDAVQALRTRVATALRVPVDDVRATALARLVCAGDLYRHVGVDTGTAGRRHLQSLVAQDPVATAVASSIRRARRNAATTGAIAATAGGVAAAGS
jgi:hypothetical protein